MFNLKHYTKQIIHSNSIKQKRGEKGMFPNEKNAYLYSKITQIQCEQMPLYSPHKYRHKPGDGGTHL